MRTPQILRSTRCLMMLLAPLFLSFGGRLALDDELFEVDLLELTQIEFVEGEPLPENIQKLDGKRIFMWGWMGPYTMEQTSEFRLVSEECSCDGPPLVQHFVLIDLGEKVTGYTPEQVKVTGTLQVGEEWKDGFLVSIYRFQAESLE